MQNQPSFGFGATGTQSTPTGLFGSGTTSASAGLFGAQTSTPAFGTGGGLFGNTTTTSTAAAPALFGATASTTNFGAPPNVSLSFGATPIPASTGMATFGAQPMTAPTLGTATASGFGAKPPTLTSFGVTSTATPGFGVTPSTAATFGGALTASMSTAPPSFGPTATATPNFGLTASTAPAFGVTASTAPGFGVTSTAAPGFGVTSTASPAFGVTTSAAPGFGVTSTAAPGFGVTSTAAPAFGVTSSAAPGFGVTSTAAPGFGVTSTAAPAFGVTSSMAPGFGFGVGTAATSTAAVPSTSLGFNLGATVTSSVAPAATSAPVGLGGLATTQTKIVTTQKDVTPKDQPLPNEILQTVEGFKEFVKQQKVYSSDIAKCSVRDFRKVEQDINHLTALLGEVESQLQQNRQLAENLKYDTAKCLKDVEIAQRTQDTPPGLQYENTAPLKFFLSLADKFERDMQVLKVQIEGADNYVKNYRSPNPLTPQDLALGMRRLHESFVALAGRLHSVHSQVESQKEAYLQTRRQLYNDHSNPFDSLYKPQESFKKISNYSPPKVATGPTPFSNLALGNTQLLALQQTQSTMSYPTPTTTAAGFGGNRFVLGYEGQRPSFPNASNLLFGSSTLAQNSNSFQLQKPPTGNKRGKQ